MMAKNDDYYESIEYINISQSIESCPFCGDNSWICGVVNKKGEYEIFKMETTPLVDAYFDFLMFVDNKLGMVMIDECCTCHAAVSVTI